MSTKDRLLVLALGFAASALQAQGSPIQRGSLQVAGTASWTHVKDVGNDNSFSSIQLSPRIAYFIARGLALSANGIFSRGSGAGQTNTAWGLGPGLTYYFGLHSRFYPFLSGRTLFTWNKSTYEGTSPVPTSKGATRSWLVSGGGLLMVGQHVGITGEVFYQKDRFSSRPEGLPEAVNRAESYGVQWGIAAFVF